jgi:hypothetical protein
MKELTGEANFNIGLVVRELIIIPQFWRQENEQKEVMLVSLNATLNSIFNHSASIKFLNSTDHYSLTGGGSFVPGEHIIELSKTSLMTYLYMYAISLKSAYEIPSIVDWAHTIFCLASRWTYFDSRQRHLFFHEPDRFVAPLDGATTLEEVELKYTEFVETQLDPSLIPLTVKVDGD